jgi:mono/diheme cytochrome c family protein
MAKGRNWLWAATGGASVLLLSAAVGLIVVETGAYDVAATRAHAPLTRWALDTTMRNSVERQAADLRPPERFTPEMIAAGAGEYQAMCAQCHGGPGIEREEWAQDMRPLPPRLTEAADDWRPRELFWIAKHGIRMTGMPAFGPTHDDATLWNIAGFVDRLPGMTAAQYAAFATDDGEAEAGDAASHGDHAHTH